MSYDPYASGPDVPPLSSDVSSARQRVQAPGIALIVVGVLNLLTALVQVGGTIYVLVMPAGEPQRMLLDLYRKLEADGSIPKGTTDQLEKQMQNQAPGDAKITSVIQNAVGSVFMLAIAVLTMLGGARMRALRSYGLSVTGAVCAAIPCLSCGGTCCFGEIIGIWALIVLLNADVKAAFQ